MSLRSWSPVSGRVPALMAMIIVSAGCRFAPSVDGTELVDCRLDDDCPRGGLCERGVCIPAPLGVEILVDPQSVEAGGVCRFTAVPIYAGSPDELTFAWRQVGGPRANLQGSETGQVTLTTESDLMASYRLEVTVRSPRTPPAVGRAVCSGLVSDDTDAWVVQGQLGSCAREAPCGTVDEALALRPSAQRLFLGVPHDRSQVVYNIDLSPNPYPEVHGGFGFPGWVRDPERFVTEIAVPGETLLVDCPGGCLVTGMTASNAPWDASGRVVRVLGTDVVLRDWTVRMEAGSIASGFFFGIYVPDTTVRVSLENVAVVAEPSETYYDGSWVGVQLAGDDTRLSDVLVDLTGRASDLKKAIDIRVEDGAFSGPTLERVIARSGPAPGTPADPDGRSIALDIDCGVPTVRNSVLDARGEGTLDSYAISMIASGCSTAPHGIRLFASTLVAGPAEDESAAIDMDIDPVNANTTLLRNNILDAGDGIDRFGIQLDSSVPAIDPASGGNVIVIDGGIDATDGVAEGSSGTLNLLELESQLECSGCFVFAATAVFAARNRHDYHLTDDSDCCRGTGLPLQPALGDPVRDLDGIMRADPPSVGAFEYRP